MRIVKLGRQGLEVPAVGLGCNFWDTSDRYGPFTNIEAFVRRRPVM